jgi:hypothetical protein
LPGSDWKCRHQDLRIRVISPIWNIIVDSVTLLWQNVTRSRIAIRNARAFSPHSNIVLGNPGDKLLRVLELGLGSHQ